MNKDKITICACSSRSFIDKEKIAEIISGLRNKSYEVSIIPDLCREVTRRSDRLSEISRETILACYPRAIRSHFNWLGLETNRLVDIRSGSLDEIIDQFPDAALIPEKQDVAPVLEELKQFPVEQGTDAWYPVIDKTRCTECGKCHDFCLFGVYTVNDKKVRVTQPQNCKNNCPACARMCPSRAIIFPKYEKSPINGGLAEEETFNPEEMDKMYRDRLRIRLQQRRNSVSLLKENKE